MLHLHNTTGTLVSEDLGFSEVDGTEHNNSDNNNNTNISPESWLRRFYRKSIIPRRQNVSETTKTEQNGSLVEGLTKTLSPSQLSILISESVRSHEGLSVADTTTAAPSVQRMTAASTPSSETTATTTTSTTSTITTTATTTLTKVANIKDYEYEYIVFLGDDNVEELDGDADTAALPLTDFNTIKMYNDLFRRRQDVINLTNEKLIKDESEIENPDDAVSEGSNSIKPLTKPTSSTASTMSTAPAPVTPAPLSITTSDVKDNIIDTESTVKISGALQDSRLTRMQQRKKFRNQLKHFYSSKQPFNFKINDLDPFRNDFQFDFSSKHPVEDIQNKMAELLKQSSSRSPQMQKLRSREAEDDIFQPSSHINKISFTDQPYSSFPSAFDYQFDDFQSTALPRKRGISFYIPANVESDLIHPWTSPGPATTS